MLVFLKGIFWNGTSKVQARIHPCEKGKAFAPPFQQQWHVGRDVGHEKALLFCFILAT